VGGIRVELPFNKQTVLFKQGRPVSIKWCFQKEPCQSEKRKENKTKQNEKSTFFNKVGER